MVPARPLKSGPPTSEPTEQILTKHVRTLSQAASVLGFVSVPEPLKNRLAGPEVDHIAERVQVVYPDFDRSRFVSIAAELERLELKDRIAAVADRLQETLPAAYPEAVSILVKAAEGGIDGFAAWPLCTVVERHGVDYPTESLEAMASLPRSWSCEFAIRPFLDHHLDETMAAIDRWIESDDADVRRLASEGTRPRLPWGPRVRALSEDPQIGLSVLERLRHDPSEMVRRSVANHLNDIAKEHPELVVETLGRWATDGTVDERMISHGLRSLVKQGHPGALAVLGFSSDAKVDVVAFAVAPESVRLGDYIELEAILKSTAKQGQRLVVDFIIHHPTTRGSRSTKVFKWATVELEAGGERTLTKRRKIDTASTRKYTAGVHTVELQVAGSVLATTSFELLDSSP